MRKRLPFLVIALVLAGAGYFLKSRDAATASTSAARIVALDVAGSDITSQTADLKTFVSSHMGATVSYQLNGALARANAAATAAAAASTAKSQIYADAQRLCSGKSDSITQAKCNQAYISSHLASIPAPVVVPAPKLSDYQHKLVSPAWTPDLAGALFVGAMAAGIFALLGMAGGKRK